jgi:hypothetical protein
VNGRSHAARARTRLLASIEVVLPANYSQFNGDNTGFLFI